MCENIAKSHIAKAGSGERTSEGDPSAVDAVSQAASETLAKPLTAPGKTRETCPQANTAEPRRLQPVVIIRSHTPQEERSFLHAASCAVSGAVAHKRR